MSTTPLADARRIFEKEIDAPEARRRGGALWALCKVVACILDHLRQCEHQRAQKGWGRVDP